MIDHKIIDYYSEENTMFVPSFINILLFNNSSRNLVLKTNFFNKF